MIVAGLQSQIGLLKERPHLVGGKTTLPSGLTLLYEMHVQWDVPDPRQEVG
jgi:hypothetical protein